MLRIARKSEASSGSVVERSVWGVSPGTDLGGETAAKLAEPDGAADGGVAPPSKADGGAMALKS